MLEWEASTLELKRSHHLEQKHMVNDYSLSVKCLKEMKMKVEASSERADSLQDHVRTLSSHEAMQKYGPGPHHVGEQA